MHLVQYILNTISKAYTCTWLFHLSGGYSQPVPTSVGRILHNHVHVHVHVHVNTHVHVHKDTHVHVHVQSVSYAKASSLIKDNDFTCTE